MKYAFLLATLAAVTSPQEMRAEAVQILDDHATDCIQQALDAVEMPNARLGQPRYGQTQNTVFISDGITANLTIDTLIFNLPRMGVAIPDRTVTFIADVTHGFENDYDYQYRRSITLTFNPSGDLTQILEGRVSSDWDLPEYEYRPGTLPDISDEQIQSVYEWVENASEAAAFMFAFCHSEQIYTPRDGDHVSPPDFLELNIQ